MKKIKKFILKWVRLALVVIWKIVWFFIGPPINFLWFLTESFHKSLAQWWLEHTKWTIVGDIPKIDKFILILAPHRQAGGDVIRGLAMKEILGFPEPTYTLIKLEVFWLPPAEHFLRWVGGLPVDRFHALPYEERETAVPALKKLLMNGRRRVLVITPAGSRTERPWERNFMRIAREANIPLVLAAFNYETRVATISEEPLYVTNDEFVEQKIMEFYGKYANGYQPVFKEKK